MLRERLLRATSTAQRHESQEISLPELSERFYLEMHVEEAFAQRMRAGAAFQMSLLRVPCQMEGQHMQTHQENSQELQRLCFGRLENRLALSLSLSLFFFHSLQFLPISINRTILYLRGN